MPPPTAIPSTTLEAGDRFEVYPSPDGRTLTLPASFLELNETIEQLIGPDGQPQPFHHDDTAASLAFSDPLSPSLADAGSLWLEYKAPGRFQLVIQREESPNLDQ